VFRLPKKKITEILEVMPSKALVLRKIRRLPKFLKLSIFRNFTNIPSFQKHSCLSLRVFENQIQCPNESETDIVCTRKKN
jgi:hypothetical protein